MQAIQELRSEGYERVGGIGYVPLETSVAS